MVEGEAERRPTRAALARVLVGALPLQFAFGLVYSWGAVAPSVEREWHWTPLLVSAVFSATPVGYGAGIVLGGRLADRLPPRRLCWSGLGLLAAGLTLALSFPSGATFIIAYSMLGLGFGGGLALAGSIAAARQVLPDRAGAAGGLVTGAYAFAAPVQVPIISLLAASMGWLPALRSLGLAMIGLGAVTLAAMPALPAPRPHPSGRAHPSLVALLRRPRLLTAILLEIAGTPLGAYAFVHAAAYAQALGLAAVVATTAITAVAIGNAAGRVAGGAVSDRLGVDRVLLAILLADLAAAAVLFLGSGPASLVAGALLAGSAFGGCAGVIGRLAEDAAADAPNSAFGLLFAGFAVGAGPGSLLGASVGGRHAWLVMGGLAGCGLLVVAWRLRLGRQVRVLGQHHEDQGQEDR